MSNGHLDRAKIEWLVGQLNALSNQASVELETFLLQVGGASQVSQEALALYLSSLVEEYGAGASAVAAQWYEAMRLLLADAEEDFEPVQWVPEAEEYIARKLQGLNWNLTDEQLASQLQGLVDEQVKFPARETLRRSAEADPSHPRYARVPAGSENCAFCEFLASRGFVYRSGESAGVSRKYHPHCDCLVVPSWGSKTPKIPGYDPEAYRARYESAVASLEREYGTSVRFTASDIQQRMRKLNPRRYGQYDPGEYKDWSGAKVRPDDDVLVAVQKLKHDKRAQAALNKWSEGASFGKEPAYIRLQKAMLTGIFDEDTAQFKEDLDYALSLARTSQWFTVDRMAPLYETFGIKHLDTIIDMVGNVLQHKPYIATSIEGPVETGTEKRVQVRILLPAGVQYAPLWLHSDYPEEKEVLLAGGNLEVIGLGKEDNPVIYLKYLKKKIK